MRSERTIFLGKTEIIFKVYIKARLVVFIFFFNRVRNGLNSCHLLLYVSYWGISLYLLSCRHNSIWDMNVNFSHKKWLHWKISPLLLFWWQFKIWAFLLFSIPGVTKTLGKHTIVKTQQRNVNLRYTFIHHKDFLACLKSLKVRNSPLRIGISIFGRCWWIQFSFLPCKNCVVRICVGSFTPASLGWPSAVPEHRQGSLPYVLSLQFTPMHWVGV